MTEIVTLFSGGTGSWAAASRIAERYGPEAQTLLFTDLYRFLSEAAGQIGSRLVKIEDGRDVWEVFRDQRFLGNNRAAICSRILKRDLARQWIDERYPDGVLVALGIDWSEIHRFERLRRNLSEKNGEPIGDWPAGDCAPCIAYDLEPIDRPHGHHWWPHTPIAPLCDPPYLDKAQIHDKLREEGIAIPRLYEWSAHNNCGGFCVRAGQAQFRALLLNMPERYAYHEAQEEAFRAEIGKDVAILRDRTGGETTPLTMREFRERIEREGGGQLSLDDWAGCGCMVDYEE